MSKTVEYYMTDYGPVPLSEREAVGIARRKNGDFDMRYKSARELATRITARAKAEYERD